MLAVYPFSADTDGMAAYSSALSSCNIVAFIATRDAARARAFYQDKLGLRFVSEDPFAVVFDAHGTILRIATVPELAPAPYTVLGWQVPDIAAAANELRANGVRFERYPGMEQDQNGIWAAPSGARIAWFKDPDGNTLSISQH
jgi:catechol 2,3-dioxygenase-like lactoylglutathione lyase family enzyme